MTSPWPSKIFFLLSLFVWRLPDFGVAALCVNPQVTALELEVTLFQSPFAVIVNESHVASFQFQRDSLSLTRLQRNLVKVAQADVVGRAARYQVLREQEHAFLSGHFARVGHVHREGQFVIGVESCLVQFQIGVFISGVAQSEAERPLDIHHRVVVVVPAHLSDVLTWFVVVCGECVDVFRISERHLSAEVAVSGEQVGERVTSVVAREHHVDDSLGQRLDVLDEARAALVENQNDGLSGLCQCFHQFLLIGRQVQVGQVARSLTVGVFAYTSDNYIGTACCGNGLPDFRRVLFPPVVVLIGRIGYARLIDDVLFPVFVAQ